MDGFVPAALAGLLLMGSLVVAVGPENAFLLRQGLGGRHVPVIVLAAILIDALLVAAGCLGLGSVISAHPVLMLGISWFGAALLVYYAVCCFRRAASPSALTAAGLGSVPLGQSLRILGTVTLLNPNVYLDTVLLVGAASARFHGLERLWYFLGATLASSLWFVLVGFGARYLSGLFANPRAWVVFEAANGLIMLWAATKMIYP